MTEKTRVIVADDHPLFREGVITSLKRNPQIEVVAEAASGEEAHALATELLPAVVLMDVNMPGIGGIMAAGRIVRDLENVRVMMLTVSENQDDLMGALKAGARGYVLKGVGAAELARAVLSVAAGEVFITPMLANGILFELTRAAPAPDPLSDLSDREKQVLSLVADGLTNKEIGEHLFLAEKTIKHYMTSVLQKLQVRSRVEAALIAQKHKNQLDNEKPN